MRRKLFGLLSAGALIAGGSVLVVAAPASAGRIAPEVDVNIEKVVHGDDPGVAFPIVLTCTSETEEAVTGVEPLADIELGQNDTDTFTVELKDGESETVTVQLPPEEPDLVTCEVTEDVSDANLPTGWECDDTPEITPSEFTLFERGENENTDEVDVTVENDCTAPEPVTTTTAAPTPTPTPAPAPKPVVAAARFTG
jgi:VCBS repeat-containing protein